MFAAGTNRFSGPAHSSRSEAPMALGSLISLAFRKRLEAEGGDPTQTMCFAWYLDDGESSPDPAQP
jgi:hypothetical protein